MGGPVSTLKYYYTQQDIAVVCMVSRETIVRWWKKGKLPTPDAMVGKRSAWLVSTIDAWVAEGGDKT